MHLCIQNTADDKISIQEDHMNVEKYRNHFAENGYDLLGIFPRTRFLRNGCIQLDTHIHSLALKYEVQFSKVLTEHLLKSMGAAKGSELPKTELFFHEEN